MEKILNLLIQKTTLFAFRLIKPFLNFTDQLTFAGQNSSLQLCQHIARMGYRRVLLVTDQMLFDLGMVEPLKNKLAEYQTELFTYSGVLPDPSTDMINQGLDVFKQHGCDAVLVLGGGSSIDTGKGIAAAATHGGIEKIVGILKLKKTTMPLFAIPTTAGTGSEVSIAAVISDPQTHEKQFMADPKLIPSAVALDPTLMLGIPKHITSATGLDALTHAVETYIASNANRQVKEYSGAAVKLIFEHLPRAYKDGSDMESREAMVLASYYAGLSINLASVGNVHAIAHQFGALYGTPHGLANAIAMPPVLDSTLDAASASMAELADLLGLTSKSDGEIDKAKLLISAIREFIQSLDIPEKLDSLKPEDIPSIAKKAVKESLQYPTPVLFSKSEMEAILKKLVC